MASDEDLFDDLREAAIEAIAFLKDVTLPALRADRMRQLALERVLEGLGETASRLTPEGRARIDHDWAALRRLRNVLAHQYGQIDHGRLYGIVKTQLPGLLAALPSSPAEDDP